MSRTCLLVLVLAGMLVLVAGCGSVSPTRTPPATASPPLPSSSASAPTPEPSISSPALAALAGEWAGSPAEEQTDQVTIEFVACGNGDVCGSGTWKHSQRCDFTLTHTPTDEGVFVFTVEAAKQMQCGWGGPETGATFRVRPAPDGTLDLTHRPASPIGGTQPPGPFMPAVTLSRSQESGS